MKGKTRPRAALLGAVVGLVLGATHHDAKADPTTRNRPVRLEHRYLHLYWDVARAHGRRSPGRNLVTRGLRTHGRVRPPSRRELARSIRTFQRWLAPPRAPVRASDYMPHGQSPAYQGGRWAIPADIVMCESGGDYGAVNSSSGAGGAYQILPSTWRAMGGTGLPQDAPPAEQDRIAAKVMAVQGRGAWAC